MQTVIILKSESETSEEYATQLLENNLNPVFVPTLGFGFKQLDILRDKLSKPENYSGIIFTSPRAVDAVREALVDDEIPAEWHNLHNYAVGEATHHLTMTYINNLDTKGKESGNAGDLAEYISERFDGDKSKPFIFPCGTLRTDAILTKLLPRGFIFDPLEVYETKTHPQLEENLDKAMKLKNVEFLAFFSPSGVSCTHEWFEKNNISLDKKKLIAIGPSTRRAIENKGLQVYKTAEKPTVDSLVKVLLNPDACREKLTLD